MRPLSMQPRDCSLPAAEIAARNRHFLDYLNFRGLPEVFLAPGAATDSRPYLGFDDLRNVLARESQTALRRLGQTSNLANGSVWVPPSPRIRRSRLRCNQARSTTTLSRAGWRP